MTICLDANCVIYLVEKNPLWGPRIIARLTVAKAAGDEIAVCDLARAEHLVGPLKSGDTEILADYQRSFHGSPHVRRYSLARGTQAVYSEDNWRRRIDI